MPRFGPFAADFAARELVKGGVRVRIQEQPLRILEALIEKPGELVTRETLKERLWPSDTFVDFERSLNASVARLRQALNDSAEEPVYVETVARKGYRFIAPVTGDGLTAAAPVPRKFPLWPGLIAGALGVALAAWVWLPAKRETARPLLRLDLEAGGEAGQPAISPDGMSVAYTIKTGLAIRRLDATGVTPLPHTEGATFPFFSPDGKWIGFFANRKLAKIPVDGGAPTSLCDAPHAGGGSWGEDGYIVAALDIKGGLSRVPASGGQPEPFTTVEENSPEVTNHRLPHLLPGGKGVLYVASDGRSAGALRAALLRGGAPKTIAAVSGGGRFVGGGYLVYQERGGLFASRFDLRTLELTGSATPLVEGVLADHFLGAGFDVSAGGTLVYRSGAAIRARRTVAWIDPAGGKEPLGVEPGEYITPRLSPDGKRVALTMISGGQPGLWVYDIAARTMTRLTFAGEFTCCPVWSPDGQFLLFSANGGLAWMRSDGAGKVEAFGPAQGDSVPWSISRNGEWLAFHRNSPVTSTDVWVSRLERNGTGLRLGEPIALVQQPGLQAAPSLSPDARWMAHGSDESGRVELYVIPFSPAGPARAGKRQITTTGLKGSHKWCGSCETIFYRGLDRRVWAVPYSVKGDTFASGKPYVWSEQRLADVGIVPAFDLASDGKRVLAVIDLDESRQDETHLRLMLNVEDELRRRFTKGSPRRAER